VTDSPLDFSICVATFRRPQLLAALVRRVSSLTGASFELVVVDDGSGDGTVNVLQELEREAGIPFKWRTIAHAGRGAALNAAFDLAKGRFIFLLDDDDAIADGALGDILATWQSIPELQRQRFCGVAGLAADPEGKVIGRQFGAEPLDGDHFSVRILGRVRGDKREVFLREALGDWRFPVVPGEYRVATNLLWFHLAKSYLIRHVNHVWLIKTYRTDGITANGLRSKVKSARLTALYNRETLRLFPDMPAHLRLRFLMDYCRFAAHAELPRRERIETCGSGLFAGFLVGLGELSARRDRRRLKV